MKKNIFLTMMVAVVAFALSSCSKDSEGQSSITYYPKLTITGDAFYISTIGQPYKDPGCTATFAGEDYTSKVVATGIENIDVNTAGLYYVTYSATGPNGLTWSETRTVAVCDPTITTDLSGTWILQSGSYRETASGAAGFEGYKVSISQLAPGIFSVSDFFGGFYDQGRGYGSAYAAKGNLQLLADNSLVCLSAKVAGWGDSLDKFYNATYDPSTDTITWDCDYAGSMTFHIILK